MTGARTEAGNVEAVAALAPECSRRAKMGKSEATRAGGAGRVAVVGNRNSVSRLSSTVFLPFLPPKV